MSAAVRLGAVPCFHHPARPAAARCPGCGRMFCRECVTDHEQAVLCAGCLAARRAASRGAAASGALAAVGTGLGAFAGIWVWFYLLGRLLIAVPDALHEGRIWSRLWE